MEDELVLGVLIKTIKGEDRINFTDSNGVSGSLQQSVLKGLALWLGVNDLEPMIMVPGKGWEKIAMPDGYVGNTRLHLEKEQVRILVMHLQKWLETGEL